MHNIFRPLIFLLILIPVTISAQSGGKVQDVVYLSDGSVLRGEVIQEDSAGVLKIRMGDGSIWAVSASNVDSVREEKFWQEPKPFDFRSPLYHIIRLGFLLGSNHDNATSSGWSFRLINGYEFRHWAKAGIGAGLDVYPNYLFSYAIIPLFLDIRGTLLPEANTPFYALQVGYGSVLGDRSADYRDKGGLTAGGEIGMRVGMGPEAAFIIGLGYSHQRASATEEFWNGVREYDFRFNRYAIKVGFEF
ncbi:MAG: hypothetical protein WD077_09455 [Bacteroidia bacterium]